MYNGYLLSSEVIDNNIPWDKGFIPMGNKKNIPSIVARFHAAS